MKNLIFYILVTLLFLFFCSFQKNSGSGDFLFVTFNGSRHDFIGERNLQYVSTIGEAYVSALSDTSRFSGYSIEIQLGDRLIGSHNLSVNSNHSVSFVQYFHSIDSTSVGRYHSISGSVNILSYDTINNSISGSFNCLLQRMETADTLRITSGAFQISN